MHQLCWCEKEIQRETKVRNGMGLNASVKGIKLRVNGKEEEEEEENQEKEKTEEEIEEKNEENEKIKEKIIGKIEDKKEVEEYQWEYQMFQIPVHLVLYHKFPSLMTKLIHC